MKIPRAHWTKAMLKSSEGNMTPHIFMSGLWGSWWCHLSPMGFGGPIHVACYLQRPRPLLCVGFPESFLTRLISWLTCLHCNLAFPFRDSQIGLSEPPYRESNTVLSCLISQVFLLVRPGSVCQQSSTPLWVLLPGWGIMGSICITTTAASSVSIAKPGKTFV